MDQFHIHSMSPYSDGWFTQFPLHNLVLPSAEDLVTDMETF